MVRCVVKETVQHAFQNPSEVCASIPLHTSFNFSVIYKLSYNFWEKSHHTILAPGQASVGRETHTGAKLRTSVEELCQPGKLAVEKLGRVLLLPLSRGSSLPRVKFRRLLFLNKARKPFCTLQNMSFQVTFQPVCTSTCL